MNVMKMFSLEGKTALLTGGAGLYGRQMAEALVEAGAETYIASRNLEKLQVAAEQCGAHALHLDLASEESMQAVIREIVGRSGRLDILVNNAVSRCACIGAEHSLADYDASLHVNASAMFYLTRLAAGVMQRQGGGSVINIGSYMGLLGPNPSNYLGTEMKTDSPIYFYEKGGMVNFTRWAAGTYGKWHIRVNCIHPGGFEDGTQPPVFVRQYSANTMLGRMAGSTDLKGILVFLASEASSYITGVNIPVDGGYSAK